MDPSIKRFCRSKVRIKAPFLIPVSTVANNYDFVYATLVIRAKFAEEECGKMENARKLLRKHKNSVVTC